MKKIVASEKFKASSSDDVPTGDELDNFVPEEDDLEDLDDFDVDDEDLDNNLTKEDL